MAALWSPPSPHLSPKYLPAGKKKFCSAPPRKSLASKKSSVFHTRGISCESTAFSFSAGKTLRAKGTRPRDGSNKPLSPQMGNRPLQNAKPPLLAPCGPLLAIQPHKRFRVSPGFDCGLRWTSVKEETPYGPAAVDWELLGKNAVVHVTVPANATAEICLPGVPEQTVGSGKYTFQVEAKER